MLYSKPLRFTCSSFLYFYYVFGIRCSSGQKRISKWPKWKHDGPQLNRQVEPCDLQFPVLVENYFFLFLVFDETVPVDTAVCHCDGSTIFTYQ